MTDKEIEDLAEIFEGRYEVPNGEFRSSFDLISFARAIEQAARATAEQSRDAQDAARYRWLRDISKPGIWTLYLSVGKALDGVNFTKEMVDKSIDAQIESQRSGDGS